MISIANSCLYWATILEISFLGGIYLSIRGDVKWQKEEKEPQ